MNEDGQDWHTLEHATPDPVLTLDFAPVPEPRVGPNRVHWDVTGDVDALLAAAPPGCGTCRAGRCSPTRRATSSACSRTGTRSDRPARSRGASTATGIVRPARRSYFTTSGASASTTSFHIASRSSPTSSRATAARSPGPDLHLGHLRGPQVAEPVGVARRARTRAHTTSPRPSRGSARTWSAACRSASGGRDHQDVDVLAAAGQPSVEGAVHPHADPVADPQPPAPQGAHRAPPSRPRPPVESPARRAVSSRTGRRGT